MGGGGSRGGSSCTHTYYEPDKVKAAQIEADAKIKVAKMEQENIELKRDAMKELLEMNAKLYGLTLEAQFRGFQKTSQALLELTKELNIISEQRFIAIESVNMGLVSKINDYYKELNKDINEETQTFMEEKLPKLLETMEKFDKDTDAYKIYQKQIDNMSTIVVENLSTNTKRISQQQNKLIESTLKSKEDLNQNINQLVEGRIKNIELQLQQSKEELTSQTKQINQKINLAIEESKENNN